MEYSGFYGGRRGASFVIVERYKTIAEMVEAFSKGGDYKVVNYDEYVIIDTENKNDTDNGKIYRRGYNYANDPTGMAGAEYVGQIVGPAGLGPHAEVIEKSEVHQKWVDAEGSPDHLDYRYGQGTYDTETNDLVPGAKGEINNRTFDDDTDKIHWEYFSLRDEHQLESTCYIGFQVPYTVFDFFTEAVAPYDGDGNYADMTAALRQPISEEHPFYEQWKLNIPKGVKGDMFKDLRVTTVGEEAEKHPGWLQAYIGEEDDEETIAKIKERKILVYDYYHYDDKDSGEPVSFYLGDFNMIDDVNVDEYGTLTLDYSHDDEEIYKNIFKWVKEIRLNKETGLFEIEYNYDKTRDGEENAKEDTKYQMYMTWVKDMAISEDGTISWTFTTSQNDKTYYNFMKWIKQVQLDAENGLFSIDFNYETEPNYKPNAGQPTHYEQSLQWVKDITINKEGTVTFDYTNKEDTIYKNYIKWIKSIQLDPDTGHMEVLYNYDNEEDGTPTKYEVDLRWLKGLKLDEDGTVHLDYTYGEDETLSKFFKFIKNVELDPETGHFKVEYNYDTDDDGNSTVYEQDLRWVNEVTIDDNGTITFDYTNGDDTVYDRYIKTIRTITLNPDNGAFDIEYNRDEEPDGSPSHYHADLRWVKEVTINEEGTIEFHYTNGQDTIYNKYIKSIREVTLNSETGDFDVYYNQDIDSKGEATHYHTKLNWLNDIEVREDGTIEFHFINGQVRTFDNVIKSIKDVTLDPETGHFEVIFNYDSHEDGTATKYETDLRWVKDMDIRDDGTIFLNYTSGHDTSYNNFLKFIKNVEVDGNTGHMIVEYNYEEKDGKPTRYETDLRWVNNIIINEEGQITLQYTTGPETILETKVKWVSDVTLDETGSFSVHFNDGTEKKLINNIKWISDVTLDDNGELKIKFNNGDPDVVKTIKWLTNVSIDTGTTEGTGSQKVQITYNTGETQTIGNPINYIMRTVLTNDYHLLILHSDPARRKAIKNPVTYDGRNDWEDMGVVKDYNGILTGLNIDSTSQPELEDISNAIEHLQQEYPDGLTEQPYKGKTVSIGKGQEDKKFYGYDYLNKTWVYLGYLNGLKDMRTVLCGDDTGENQALAKQMSTGSIWFITEGE